MGNLDLSYLTLTSDSMKKVADALIKAQESGILKLRSSISSTTIVTLEKRFTEVLKVNEQNFLNVKK